MIDGYKVVCVTPAGRSRYMRELVPHVLSSACVDRYDIWLNTTVELDIQFIEALKQFDKVNIIQQPDGRVDGINSIGAFFRTTVEENTVYVRLDDDIVYLEEGAIEKLVRFRIQNPHYFLVSPLVINNAVVTNILQDRGLLPLGPRVRADAGDPVGWRDGQFASRLWSYFLALVRTGRTDSLHTGLQPVAQNRFSINCISWLGETFATFGGQIDTDEEEYITVVKPGQLGISNCIFGQTIVGHYSFWPQRSFMDSTNILMDVREVNRSLPYVDQHVYETVARLAGRLEQEMADRCKPDLAALRQAMLPIELRADAALLDAAISGEDWRVVARRQPFSPRYWQALRRLQRAARDMGLRKK